MVLRRRRNNVVTSFSVYWVRPFIFNSSLLQTHPQRNSYKYTVWQKQRGKKRKQWLGDWYKFTFPTMNLIHFNWHRLVQRSVGFQLQVNHSWYYHKARYGQIQQTTNWWYSLIFLRNLVLMFHENFSLGSNLHEISNYIFEEKYENITKWHLLKCLPSTESIITAVILRPSTTHRRTQRWIMLDEIRTYQRGKKKTFIET